MRLPVLLKKHTTGTAATSRPGPKLPVPLTRSGGASCGARATRTLGAWPGPARPRVPGDSEDRPCVYIHAPTAGEPGPGKPGLCRARSPILSLPCPPRGPRLVPTWRNLQGSTPHKYYPGCIIRFSVWAGHKADAGDRKVATQGRPQLTRRRQPAGCSAVSTAHYHT